MIDITGSSYVICRRTRTFVLPHFLCHLSLAATLSFPPACHPTCSQGQMIQRCCHMTQDNECAALLQHDREEICSNTLCQSVPEFSRTMLCSLKEQFTQNWLPLTVMLMLAVQKIGLYPLNLLMCIKRNDALEVYEGCLVSRMNFCSFAIKFACFPMEVLVFFQINSCVNIYDWKKFANFTFSSHGTGDIAPVNSNISAPRCQCELNLQEI